MPAESSSSRLRRARAVPWKPGRSSSAVCLGFVFFFAAWELRVLHDMRPLLCRRLPLGADSDPDCAGYVSGLHIRRSRLEVEELLRRFLPSCVAEAKLRDAVDAELSHPPAIDRETWAEECERACVTRCHKP